MNNYLLKWSCNGKSAYKTGISKREETPLLIKFNTSYKDTLFEVQELANIYCYCESYSLARAAAYGIGHTLRAVFPKDFQLEDHFNLKPGELDGMPGISEFFLLPSYISEEDMISIFERAQTTIWQLNNKLKSYQGTVQAEIDI